MIDLSHPGTIDVSLWDMVMSGAKAHAQDFLKIYGNLRPYRNKIRDSNLA